MGWDIFVIIVYIKCLVLRDACDGIDRRRRRIVRRVRGLM